MKPCIHRYQIDNQDVGVCSLCDKRVDFRAMQDKKWKKGEDKSFVTIAIPHNKLRSGVRWERI